MLLQTRAAPNKMKDFLLDFTKFIITSPYSVFLIYNKIQLN